jgi:hypothetical protein
MVNSNFLTTTNEIFRSVDQRRGRATRVVMCCRRWPLAGSHQASKADPSDVKIPSDDVRRFVYPASLVVWELRICRI